MRKRTCDGVGDVRPPRPPALIPLDDSPGGGRPAEGVSCMEYLYRVSGHCDRRFLDVKGYVDLTGDYTYCISRRNFRGGMHLRVR